MRVLIDADLPYSAKLPVALGFADLRGYPPRGHFGIVVLRVPSDWIASQILKSLHAFLERVGPERLEKALVIVEPGGYRIRR